MALDLGLVEDFADPVPRAFAELFDEVHQFLIHLLCEAGYLLFDILFPLHTVLI